MFVLLTRVSRTRSRQWTGWRCSTEYGWLSKAQLNLRMFPVTRIRSSRSGLRRDRATDSAGCRRPATITRPSSSGGRTAAFGAFPLPVRKMARAVAFLPSASATSGNAPSPAVTSTSYRSAIPTSSASVFVCLAG